MKRVTLAIVMLFGLATVASGQTVFLVRHAEREDAPRTQGAPGAPARDPLGAQGARRATEPGSGAAAGQKMMAADPELSAAGRARAEALAVALKHAGVSRIFTTEFKRTQQTAAPLAKQLGIQITIVHSKDTPALIRELNSAKETVLVVGHSNTIPAIIKALGVDVPVTVGDDDYDNLFVVTRGGRAALLRLHYR